MENSPLNDSRRKFIRNGAIAATGFFIVPRHVLGRGFVAPSDKLNIGSIGIGGKGSSDIANFFKSGNANIVALCDVHDAEGQKKTRSLHPKAAFYKDFREMLDKEKNNIDAVSVSTPDHMHAVAAMAAMQLKKHVYVQKPMTHDIFEARMLTEAARRYQVVTQMGNQGSSGDGVRTMQEWYNAGLIGDAHTIRCWTNRPVWPQGIAAPTAKEEVPAELDWNLWLGPTQFQDYHQTYVPFSWRGFWAFGTGALGDMGCHIIDPAFKVVGLGYPSEVECSVADFYETMWRPAYHPESCPPASSITLKFPATKKGKPDVKLTWMDGNIRPERPAELGPDEQMGNSDGGAIIEGTKGKMMCGCYGANPTLLPTSKTKEVNVKQTIERVPGGQEGHYAQWVNACIAGYGKGKTSSNFDYAGPLTETVLFSNLALRAWNIKEGNRFPGRKKILWDAVNMKVTNFDQANQFIKRTYRDGYSLNV